MSNPSSPITDSPPPPPRLLTTRSSSFLLKNIDDEKVVNTIHELEKQLDVEIKVLEGAENIARTLTKKKDQQQALKKAEEISENVEKIREKLASLNKKALIRHGGAHSVTDVVDMIDSMKLPQEEIVKKMEWVAEKIKLETKVKAGAEKLAKSYGATIQDKKLMAEVFAKLMDSNAKLDILKISLQKYRVKLGLSPIESESEKDQNEQDEGQRNWKRTSVTGRLKVKIFGARDLGPSHKKLDAKIVLKVDSKIKDKTSVKSKANKPQWNEEFDITLDSAGEIELHLFDKNDLYSILFFDMSLLKNVETLTEEKEYEMEPRGLVHLKIEFTKRETVLRRRSKIGRRGAVKSKIPASIIHFLGYDQSFEIASSSKKEKEMIQERKPSIRAKEKITKQPEESKTLKRSKSKKMSSMDDFLLIRVLGKGNFGKVMLVEEKTSHKLYAIKVLKKDFILENEEIESLKSEKRVFEIANRERHPFLVQLYSCFQAKDRIFFVMEYVSGGDLMWHIQRQIFSEQRAKLYAAEVLLALEYLHKNGVVYRDLKLDNILLDLDGHVRIADYGLCKENMGYGKTTNTFCGTPEFMAPEILLEQPYGRAVDWWAFGVLIYEMLLAQSPFKGDEEEEIFDSILAGNVNYPAKLAPEAISILKQLLHKDPKKRLGGGPSDSEEIKKHPFFKGFDWDAILQKKVTIDYKPQIKDEKDTTNFDPEFTREVPRLTPIHSRIREADQLEFEGFSYTAEWLEDEK